MKYLFLNLFALLASSFLFAQTTAPLFFIKNYSVNASKAVTLTDDGNQPLQANRQYRVKMVTYGTGVRTGAEYLVWKNGATWSARPVSLAGTNSNHPLLVIENDTVKIKTNHPNSYGVKVYTEAVDLLNPSTSPSFFGASNHWQREIGSLYYTDGNVGIGITNPSEKLTVQGKVLAEEIKVQVRTSWPDYVFDESYELEPLEYLEKYISQHKHLPGIPSASDVKEKGIELGAMQGLLLKKIEELTIHIIELKKSNDQILKEKEKQSVEIRELKQRINKISKLAGE